MKTPTPVTRSDPRKSLLPWLGALGHTFFVIEPDTRPDNIYGGWRNLCEASCLAHCEDMKLPGRQIWQKTGKGKYVKVWERAADDYKMEDVK